MDIRHKRRENKDKQGVSAKDRRAFHKILSWGQDVLTKEL